MQLVDRKARSAPISANRLLAAIKTLSTWASSRGHLQTNIAATLRKPARETPRDRVLSLSEVAAIWRAAEQLGGVWEATYKLLILTAQRREEVASMRWDEIDLQRAEWSIPAPRTKNRQPHVVPLSPAATAVLGAIKARKSDSAYVFTTTGRTPISGFSKSKARLDELSGVTNWRIHDLRRTAVTHMAEAGVDPWVADRILNHVASSTLGTVQRVYQLSQMLNERRAALALWAEKVVQENFRANARSARA